MTNYLDLTIFSLEEELAEKKNELFPRQYHELRPLEEELYRWKLEQERKQVERS
uniref:Uncharacterized protein n=1 Tax=Candidatus Kentrum sp. SD TaxID=2126332 RepID=A0A450YRL1_9GAMM|nr:MAG: hypothetical protein BECKSD772F_GA0070984_11689 [Candidatus Kentron sp. SD]VFK44487.1 MAG: hypothetical protein BECKSD772E_GA0070983_103827 [Candidatus Kentron sp. SD]VFK81079.1 MAG: hypothetical protein BECKSD772D_GA0070982_12156 [Candidatus Kentron sp. SD]